MTTNTVNGTWQELSNALVATVRTAAASVVRVDGGRRPSSGVAWSGDGTIVTTSHAVDDDEVTVGLPSGETVEGEVLGRDPSTDLAVVRARGAATLPAPVWAEASLEVGQLVSSVTRPGRGARAGLGIVSRLGDPWRTQSGGKLDRYVELGIELHPGFSGGLVLDAAGRAIGLGSAGLVRGTALAVPHATLIRVVTALLAHGAVRRGYLGIATFPVKHGAGGEQQPTALLVTAVEDGSPAAAAGLIVGDVLLALDGAPTTRLGDLLALLDDEHVGQGVPARILRGGAPREVTITIGVRNGGERR